MLWCQQYQNIHVFTLFLTVVVSNTNNPRRKQTFTTGQYDQTPLGMLSYYNEQNICCDKANNMQYKNTLKIICEFTAKRYVKN